MRVSVMWATKNACRLLFLPVGRRWPSLLSLSLVNSEGCEFPSQGLCNNNASSNTSHWTEFTYNLRRGHAERVAPEGQPQSHLGPA